MSIHWVLNRVFTWWTNGRAVVAGPVAVEFAAQAGARVARAKVRTTMYFETRKRNLLNKIGPYSNSKDLKIPDFPKKAKSQNAKNKRLEMEGGAYYEPYFRQDLTPNLLGIGNEKGLK